MNAIDKKHPIPRHSVRDGSDGIKSHARHPLSPPPPAVALPFMMRSNISVFAPARCSESKAASIMATVIRALELMVLIRYYDAAFISIWRL